MNYFRTTEQLQEMHNNLNKIRNYEKAMKEYIHGNGKALANKDLPLTIQNALFQIVAMIPSLLVNSDKQ